MKAIHKFLVGCFSILFPSKIYGKENIPEGGVLFSCNHFSACDCGYLARAYNKDIYFLAKKELFKNKLFSKIIKSFGAIPIDRENPDMKTMLSVIKILKADHKLVVFPEGTRNTTGTDALQDLKGGVPIFAVKAKKPILPVMILKKAGIFRRAKLLIGKPFEFSEYYGKKLTDEDLKEMDIILRQKMTEVQVELKEILSKKKKRCK